MSDLKNHGCDLNSYYSSNLLVDPIIADIEVPAINHEVEQVSKSFFDVDRSLPDSFGANLDPFSSDVSQSVSSNEEKSRSVAQKSMVRSSKSQMIKKTKRKTWKKPEGKPKRPMSSYNLYFQLERERILKNQPEKDYTIKDIDRIIHKNKIMEMLPQPKRKHEKSHGKIGFKEMAKLFADKWKALDPSKKQIFFDRAAVEKKLYVKAVKEWESEEKKSTKQSSSKSHESIEVDFKKALPKVEGIEFQGISQNVKSAASNVVPGEHFEESPVSVRGELSLQEVTVIVKQFQDKYHPHVANSELDISGNDDLDNKQEGSLLTLFGTQFGVVSSDQQHQNSSLNVGQEKMTLQNLVNTLNTPAQGYYCQDMNIQNNFEQPIAGEGLLFQNSATMYIPNNNQESDANTFPKCNNEDGNNSRIEYSNSEDVIVHQGYHQNLSMQNQYNTPMVGEGSYLQNKPTMYLQNHNQENNATNTYPPYNNMYDQDVNTKNILCNNPRVGEGSSLQNNPTMYIPYKNHQENNANISPFNTEKNNIDCTMYNFDSEDATIMRYGYCQDINGQNVCDEPTVAERFLLQNNPSAYIMHNNQKTNTNALPPFNAKNGNHNNTDYNLNPEDALMRQFLFLQS